LSKDSPFHAPLHPRDTVAQTHGCAFARDDGMCLAPPKSWARQFAKLTRYKTMDK
jgi:nitrite reductase/ring-hydroxylating ferredoxin subunit